MIEDKVLDLVIIFESLYNTLSKLRRQCELHCLGDRCGDDCSCASTIEELEEQMHEAQVNLKKVDILHKRAQGTAQLVSTRPSLVSSRLTNTRSALRLVRL